MTKTENKREEKKRKVIMPAGIRNKLVAAISMLMVASIMMVSSTYAWFTLSTAPEVKGITTNVGANGNLEMLLLNKDSYKSAADDLGVTSGVGDSYAVLPLSEANEKWGNLVDLSDATYGLGAIVLNPSRLNFATGDSKKLDAASMLLAPSYGNDGRVIDVTSLTYGGKTENNGTTWTNDEDHAGVRALGVSSGASVRGSAWTSANAAAASNKTAAQNTAKSTLTLYGQDLANILVRHVQYRDDAAKDVYTLNEIKSLQSMVQTLQTANDTAGDAIVKSVLAYNLSTSNTDTLTDADVNALVLAMEDITPSDLATLTYNKVDGETTTPTAILQPNGLADHVDAWENNNTAISTAKTTVDDLVAEAKESYTYTDIESVVNGLINREQTEIGGVKNPNSSNISDFIAYMGAHDGRIDITMLDNSGVYAEIARLVGNYASSVIELTVNYNENDMFVKTIMSTNVTVLTAIPVGAKFTATVGGAGTTTTLSEIYGYALDFGFRTNAADSSLQLQTAAKQRVYAGSEAENTQGGGSYMQFTTANPNVFSTDEVRALMSAIRVVFLAPNETGSEVLGIARLNITTGTDANGVPTYTGGSLIAANGTVLSDTATDAQKKAATGVKAELLMCEYTVDENGILTAGAVKADETAIATLEQNKAKKITVVVYVDGDIVDNTMVANASTSMSGKLNLQFSSSADLTPMANARMQAGGENQQGVTATYTQVAQAGDTYTFNGTAYTVKDGYVIAVREGGTGAPYYKVATAADSTYIQMTASNYTTALQETSSDGT